MRQRFRPIRGILPALGTCFYSSACPGQLRNLSGRAGALWKSYSEVLCYTQPPQLMQAFYEPNDCCWPYAVNVNPMLVGTFGYLSPVASVP